MHLVRTRGRAPFVPKTTGRGRHMGSSFPFHGVVDNAITRVSKRVTPGVLFVVGPNRLMQNDVLTIQHQQQQQKLLLTPYT